MLGLGATSNAGLTVSEGRWGKDARAIPCRRFLDQGSRIGVTINQAIAVPTAGFPATSNELTASKPNKFEYDWLRPLLISCDGPAKTHQANP